MEILKNPYRVVLERNLPRVLSLVCQDTSGNSIGIADRRYWAWKTTDFPNASMQSLAGGFARLANWSEMNKTFRDVNFAEGALNLIYAIRSMTSRTGGLAEAFPNEDSFCVTGQVLAETLDAVAILENKLNMQQKEKCYEILEPLANFLLKNNETHGIISNHLATSALAMVRWGTLLKNQSAFDRAEYFLREIVTHSSNEGWFMEYFGADPGYQTWALSSLAQISNECPNIIDNNVIKNGIKFITPFALANGSFSNGAGARLTNFFMALGPELMAESSDEASFLALFARKHISSQKFVSLDSVDEPNLAPFFNDVVRAAELFDVTPNLNSNFTQSPKSDFPDAGLFVRHNNLKSILVSSIRGGWTCLAKVGEPTVIKGENIFVDKSGSKYISRRGVNVEINSNQISVKSPIHRIKSKLPSPAKFVFLRLFLLSIGRWRTPREVAKRFMVFYLIKRKYRSVGFAKRTIQLDSGEVEDDWQSDIPLTLMKCTGAPFHMASADYWRF
jgi:hypothetical protein